MYVDEVVAEDEVGKSEDEVGGFVDEVGKSEDEVGGFVECDTSLGLTRFTRGYRAS